MQQPTNQSINSLKKDYLRIIKKLPTNRPIFLPTEEIELEDALKGVKIVEEIYNDRLHRIYRPKLQDLKNKYQGHNRCFLIGNGPSINKTDLSLLKDEVTFAVNGFFLKMNELNWTPTFYVVEDHLVAEDRRDRINKLKGPIKLFPVYLAYCLNEAEDTIFYNHQPRKSYPHGFDFSTDASEITFTGCTVIYSCMQLAFYFGFREIYLIGVDASYELPEDVEQGDQYGVDVLDMMSDDPNHFHPDYFGKGYRWHDPQVNKMVEAYQEARRVIERTNQRIYNATIGGKLEVFERRDYYHIFRETKPVVSKEYYPNLLIIDSTPVGQLSATGQLKQTFLENWPRSSILQIWTSDGKNPSAHIIRKGQSVRESQVRDFSTNSIIETCQNFNPDIVYFRPVDSKLLFEIALKIISIINKPLVIHMMDDWPEKLRNTDKKRFSILNGLLQQIIDISCLQLSISEAMSKAYNKRYGKKWLPLANGVDLVDFPAKDWLSRDPLTKDKPFVIRYMGALAEDMGYNSVKDIAYAVSSLTKSYPVKLEIYTMDWCLHKAKQELGIIRGVEIKKLVDFSAYKNCLCEADALVIAYNFDVKSIRYVRLSLANKMPECLASGVPLLVYGPSQVATVDYLKKTECALVVDQKQQKLLYAAIEKLITEPETCKELSIKGRIYVSKNLTKQQMKNNFHDYMLRAMKAVNDDKQLLVGPFERVFSAHYDETVLIAELFSNVLSGKTMIDVGAHHGSSLIPFLNKGWKIYAFEPDDKNRNTLLKRISEHKNRSFIKVDSRCVTKESKTGIGFYTSTQSTGISSLTPFHDSHIETKKVETVSLTDYFKNNSIPEMDFLKIDTEGHDLFVLKGFPWERAKPKVIECEFEDAKTMPLGYSFHDLAKFLVEKGYSVYVSEWHPIIHYGIRHDWKQLMCYPCELSNPLSWGNLIAFRDSLDHSVIAEAIWKHIKLYGYQEDYNYLGIISSGNVVIDKNGYKIFPEYANNWIACRYNGEINAGDRVTCKVTFKTNTRCTIRIMLCRDGTTEFEATDHKRILKKGKHTFELTHQFENKHEGLRIQTGVVDKVVKISNVESGITILSENNVIELDDKNFHTKKTKSLFLWFKYLKNFIKKSFHMLANVMFPQNSKRRNYAKKIKHLFANGFNRS